MILILATFFFVIAPGALEAGPLLQPCPNGTQHVPDCIDVSVSVVTNSTNSTVLFDLTDISAYITVDWGNTTSYMFTANSSVDYQNTNQWYPIALDFLQPSEKYYYKLIATDTGENSVTKTGSWTTSADSKNSTISGSIVNVQGKKPGAGVYVYATCASWLPGWGPNSNPAGWTSWAVTNSNGQYSISTSGTYTPQFAANCADEGHDFAVSVVNTPTQYILGGVVHMSAVFPGNWNESIVAWAPQVVNFHLSLNYVSGFIPMTYDFTNSSYAEFTVTKSTTLTTTESYSLSIQGAFSGISVGGGTSSMASATVSTSSTLSGVKGDSFVIQQEYWVSGTTVFNGVTRSVSPFATYLEPSGTIGSGPTNVSDWMTRPACNSDPGVVFCQDYDGSTPFYANMTTGGSYSLSTSFNVGVSIPVYIPGIGTLTFSATASYTTGFMAAGSYTVGIAVSPPSNVCYGFEYVFQGDSSGTYGVVAHAWNLGDQPSSDCG
ncbi:MAG: hypothetical protein WB782_07045 [Thermoplasmata archaeon]